MVHSLIHATDKSDRSNLTDAEAPRLAVSLLQLDPAALAMTEGKLQRMTPQFSIKWQRSFTGHRLSHEMTMIEDSGGRTCQDMDSGEVVN